jgi:hypothetical protein
VYDQVAASGGTDGYVYDTNYWDGETGQWADQIWSNSQGSPSGTNGLGSDFDYVTFNSGSTWDYFGSGYWEADAIV